jgi:hypothetical protein
MYFTLVELVSHMLNQTMGVIYKAWGMRFEFF